MCAWIYVLKDYTCLRIEKERWESREETKTAAEVVVRAKCQGDGGPVYLRAMWDSALIFFSGMDAPVFISQDICKLFNQTSWQLTLISWGGSENVTCFYNYNRTNSGKYHLQSILLLG